MMVREKEVFSRILSLETTGKIELDFILYPNGS